MNSNQNNEKLKIKVNRVSSDKGNSYPYTKYLKSNYPQISKISQKNPILYKVKYKPEIIINEYHQTSNNINTNINIKTNKPKKPNLNNSRNITNNFMDQRKIIHLIEAMKIMDMTILSKGKNIIEIMLILIIINLSIKVGKYVALILYLIK